MLVERASTHMITTVRASQATEPVPRQGSLMATAALRFEPQHALSTLVTL